MSSKPRGPALEWYGVRTIYEHPDLPPDDPTCTTYEERIVIFKAESAEDAIRQGEVEAKDYVKGLGDTTYLGFAQSYHTFEARMKAGAEVYSLMRESGLAPEDYIDRFFDCGTERIKDADEE
jgi:hypothetical protein